MSYLHDFNYVVERNRPYVTTKSDLRSYILLGIRSLSTAHQSIPLRFKPVYAAQLP